MQRLLRSRRVRLLGVPRASAPLAALLVAAFAAACHVPSPTPVGSVPVRVVIDTVSALAGSGQDLVFRTVLENLSAATVELPLVAARRDDVSYDVHVLDRQGTLVWQRNQLPPELPGVVNLIVGAGRTIHLAPHGRITWLTAWNRRSASGLRLPAGRYTAIAIVPVDTGGEFRSASFLITLPP